VREATFNALHSLGAVEDASVLDLFAGSGALGIEALSRGASHATFVDRDAGAVAAVRANLEATGLAGRATVVRGDAADHAGTPVDLALLDPPYDLAEAAWSGLLAKLRAGLVVLETPAPVVLPAGWSVLREKRYGTTVVTFARQEGTPHP
jgi:16S rRNA (guanine966-N2)-methyltransferase